MKYKIKFHMDGEWNMSAIVPEEELKYVRNLYVNSYDSYFPKGSFKSSNAIIPFRNVKSIEWEPAKDDE